MQIETLVQTIEGQINETSKIEEIYSATVYVSNVGEGSLFISSVPSEIEEAIGRGAQAIIYDDATLGISDSDLAWIKVDDIEEAAFRLTQYVVVDSEADFYYLNRHELSFLRMILLRKSDIDFIPDDWKKAFEMVLNSKKKIFISSNLELMKKLRPKAKRLVKEVDGYIISDTLFRSTFKVEKYVYQYKEMVPFHLEHLLKVVAFCQQHHFEYAIEKIKYIKQFIPIFIDGEPGINEQSKNDRTVIVCDNLEDIIEARLYVNAPSAWIVKSIVLTPPKTKVEGVKRPSYYYNNEDILEILKGANFNYAFIYAEDRSIIEMIKKEYNIFT